MSSPASNASSGRRNPARAVAGVTPWRVMTGKDKLRSMSQAPRGLLSEAEMHELDTFLSRQRRKKSKESKSADVSQDLILEYPALPGNHPHDSSATPSKAQLAGNTTRDLTPKASQDVNIHPETLSPSSSSLGNGGVQAAGAHVHDAHVQVADAQGSYDDDRAPRNAITPPRPQDLWPDELLENFEGQRRDVSLVAPETAPPPRPNNSGLIPRRHQLESPSLQSQNRHPSTTPISPLAHRTREWAGIGYQGLSSRLTFPPLSLDSQLDALPRKPKCPSTMPSSAFSTPGRENTGRSGQRRASRLTMRSLSGSKLLALSNEPDGGKLAEESQGPDESLSQGGDVPILVVDPEFILFCGFFITVMWVFWLLWTT